jgi:hypothetical protein
VEGDGTAFRLTTEPFAEAALAKRLAKAPGAKAYLAGMRWEGLGETEGYKARIASFSARAQ